MVNLSGLPLLYLIGASVPETTRRLPGVSGSLTMCPFDALPTLADMSAGYCTCFDEKNEGRFGPYREPSDTAREYDEGEIDPDGPGWHANLVDQFERRQREGFKIIELDNTNAYAWRYILAAIELAKVYNLAVIAKNPGLRHYGEYVAHSNVCGIIVEKGAGNTTSNHNLRLQAKRPNLPVWFVAHGRKEEDWIRAIGQEIKTNGYKNMSATRSTGAEYSNSIQVVEPRT